MKKLFLSCFFLCAAVMTFSLQADVSVDDVEEIAFEKRNPQELAGIKTFAVFNFGKTAEDQQIFQDACKEQLGAIGRVVPLAWEDVPVALHRSLWIYFVHATDDDAGAIVLQVTAPLKDMADPEKADEDGAIWGSLTTYHQSFHMAGALEQVITRFCEDYKTGNQIPDGSQPVFYLIPQ